MSPCRSRQRSAPRHPFKSAAATAARRSTALLALASCCTKMTTVVAVTERRGPLLEPRAAWKIPPFAPKPYSRRHNAFLEECESVAAFLAQLRGGGDDYYGSNNNNYNNNRYGSSSSPDRYYSNNNNNNYYNDDRGYDYSKRRGRHDEEEDDEYYYDYMDNNNSPNRRGSNSRNGASILSSLPAVFTTGNRQIGMSLLGAGAVITMMGISLFFNKSLMRLGNLLVVAGVPMTIGPSRTAGYFLQPEKTRATACLAFGILLVFMGSPVFGMALEVFGILNLFGNMFPVIFALAKNMPVIGPILSGGGNNNNGNRRRNNNGNGSYGRRRDDEDDDNYYNGGGRQGGGGGYDGGGNDGFY